VMPFETKTRGFRGLRIPLFFICVFAILLVLAGIARLVIIAALLAYILDPLVTTLELRGMTRRLATVVLLLLFGIVLGVAACVLVPVLMYQVQSLQSGSVLEHTSSAISRLETLIRIKLGFLGLQEIDLLEKIQEAKRYLGGRVADFLIQDGASLAVHAVFIPFIMFFLLTDGRKMKKDFLRLIPNRYFEFVLYLLYKMDLQLGNYLRGQFADAVVFGVLTTTALWLLKIKYFLFIGAFAGLANLIPLVGPIAGVVPAVVVAVLDTGDVVRGGYVVLAFVVLKLIDDTVVQPLVVGRSVNLHPMLVAISILVGGQMFGILGMLLAVPCAGFLKVVLSESIATFQKYRFS